MVKEIYNPYEKYGIKRVINAAAVATNVGGSISPPEVFRAMEDASKSYVYIPEVQAWAGKVIAEVTGAEAGLPTAGACHGILLAAAACMMKGTELEKYDPLEKETWTSIAQKLPMHSEGLKTEFIVQKCDRNVYDHSVECAGGRFVEIGTANGTTEQELDEAFNPQKTAAYYVTLRTDYRPLPLKTVIKIAHKHNAPIIVDAATENPPKKSLKRFIEMGVDLVVLSGGKEVRGPNNSGILAGRKDLIKLAHLQAYPFHGVGRSGKMSRETIVGFVTALKLYVAHDEEAVFKARVAKAKWISEQLNKIPNLKTDIFYMTTVVDKEPMVPLVGVKIDEKAFGMTGKDLSDKLMASNPKIYAPYESRFLGPNSAGTLDAYNGKVTINPRGMLEGDEEIVVEKIKEILAARKLQPIKQK